MLSHKQKAHLSQLASRAYHRAAAMARGRGEPAWDMSYKAVNEYRHAEVIKAVGKNGLRCCSQLDYKAVEGHFLNLLGQVKPAFRAHMRSATEPHRQAEAILTIAIRQAADVGITAAYAEAICKTQNKCHILECDEKQLWNLIYTIRNRAAARRRARESEIRSDRSVRSVPSHHQEAA